jgi:hypothetical protein
MARSCSHGPWNLFQKRSNGEVHHRISQLRRRALDFERGKSTLIHALIALVAGDASKLAEDNRCLSQAFCRGSHTEMWAQNLIA